MKNILRPALVVFFALTLVTGIAYPLVVTGIAQSLFPAQAGGSLITRDGKPASHFENTVLVTEGDPEILTIPTKSKK